MTTNVLILCTDNSARSVLAEAMLNHWAAKLDKDVRAFSAGSAPSGRLNPFALEALANAGVDVSNCRSKSWDEFSGTEHWRGLLVHGFDLVREPCRSIRPHVHETFAGIAPASTAGFAAAELLGAAVGLALHTALEPRTQSQGLSDGIESAGKRGETH